MNILGGDTLCKKNILACLAVITSIVILNLLAVFGTPFFQDYPIFFDGGYRISLGQIPFHDFAMPPIPIGFYMQAFFDLIFGANLFSMAMLSIFLSSILAVAFYFISRKYFGTFFSIFMAVSLAYSYSGIIGFPWYNQTAFFFVILNILLLMKSIDSKEINTRVLVLSSILAILSILSKTDIGAIHFVVILAYFIYLNKKDLKRIIILYATPVISSIIVLNFVIKLIGTTLFKNGIYIERILGLLEKGIIEKAIYSFSFYVIIFLIVLYMDEIKKGVKNNLLAMILLFNLFILGAGVTSGQAIQTKILALPLNLLLIYLLLSKKLQLEQENGGRNGQIYKKIAIFVIFLLIFTQFNDLSNRRERYEFTVPTRQVYNLFFADPAVSGFTKIDFGCYKGIPLKNEYYKELSNIRGIIEENNRSFIIMGDYLFLYCDYNTQPPKNLPLWFHEGNTFGKNEVKSILEYFDKERPRVVIEQMLASKETKKQLANKLISLGYYENYSAATPSPAGLMKIFVLQENIK